jgi:hypothetical protein
LLIKANPKSEAKAQSKSTTKSEAKAQSKSTTKSEQPKAQSTNVNDFYA